MDLRRRIPPALILFFLSPVVGELLSGSAPPVEFFTPFGLFFIVGLYGSGAVLVREARARWRKGLGSALLLGCAYGILEEGLMVASFFNPKWMDLGVLGVYGRWLEVNWVWAAELTLYHSVVSITIPIMMVELAYPDRRSEPWLGGRTLKSVIVLLGSVVSVGFILFSFFLKYWPPPVQYLSFAGLMFFFAAWARRLPADWARRGRRRMRRPLFFVAVGFLAAVVEGLVFWILPNVYSLLPPPVVILIGLGIFLGVVRFLRGFDWRRATDLHRFGLAAGPLLLFVVFAFFQEADRSRTDNPAGMGLVGLTFLIGLLAMGWRIRRMSRIHVLTDQAVSLESKDLQ